MSVFKPCPFCGGIRLDIDDVRENEFTKYFMYIKCVDCGAAIYFTDKKKCLNDIIKAWNRRANE